jgi:hypothetical protein
MDDFPDVKDIEDCFINNAKLDQIEAYLGRFNPIRIMRMENMEIRHSAILAWLLDPLETHGFGDKFLRAFLSQALRGQDSKYEPSALDVSQADLRDAKIRREKQNIDLFVASPSNGWAFIIENKFQSKQHSGQLKRYSDHAIEEARDAGLSFKHRGIFLTLHEEDPDEEAQDGYVTLRYEDVCTILNALLNGGAANIGTEVRQFLVHYLEIIRDAAGMNDEQTRMEALAKKLYRTHTKVLDFVMKHGASTEFTMAAEILFGSDRKNGDEVAVEGHSYMINRYNDRQFSFLPAPWRASLGGESKKQLWTGCGNWWAEYPLICWFQLYKEDDGVKGRLRLFAEIGPLDNPEHRLKLIELIKNAADKASINEIQFSANAEKPKARFSKFLKAPGNSIPIADVSDLEVIEQGMRRLLKKFTPTFEMVSESLPDFVKFVENEDSL